MMISFLFSEKENALEINSDFNAYDFSHFVALRTLLGVLDNSNENAYFSG